MLKRKHCLSTICVTIFNRYTGNMTLHEVVLHLRHASSFRHTQGAFPLKTSSATDPFERLLTLLTHSSQFYVRRSTS